MCFVPGCVGGDKIPRKGGPGITQSDLLVINKTDLAEAVGADLKVKTYTNALRLIPVHVLYFNNTVISRF